jgi:hypothetical protein
MTSRSCVFALAGLDRFQEKMRRADDLFAGAALIAAGGVGMRMTVVIVSGIRRMSLTGFVNSSYHMHKRALTVTAVRVLLVDRDRLAAGSLRPLCALGCLSVCRTDKWGLCSQRARTTIRACLESLF